MKSIKIEGLRSIKNSGYVPIKPLTILLGENSSGKSTFLRTFPLLRQSIDSSTRGPILWYGSYVDFGIFEDAVSKFSDDKTISFSFIIDVNEIINDIPKRYTRLAGLTDSEIEVSLSLISDDKDKGTRVKSFSFKYKDNYIDVQIGKTGKVTTIIANDIDITDGFNEVFTEPDNNRYNLLPQLKYNKSSERFFSPFSEYVNRELDDKVTDLISELLHSQSNKKTVLEKLQKLTIDNKVNFNTQLKMASPTKTWLNRINSMSLENETLNRIKSYLLGYKLPWLVLFVNNTLVEELNTVKYLAPLRATAERFYRSQDLSVDEVDYQGKNLAMFIKNLSQKEKDDYSTWLLENFGFDLQAKSEGGHLSLHLTYHNSSSSYNITDMGFGFSQILPIITQLWFSINSKISQNIFSRRRRGNYLIIEQPELHLHPRFQAKMIDAFIKCINLSKENETNIKLIIETHSETIVNQIGHRISESLLEKDDVSITIFDKEYPDSPTNVSFSSYDENGYLKDWPWVFFEPELC